MAQRQRLASFIHGLPKCNGCQNIEESLIRQGVSAIIDCACVFNVVCICKSAGCESGVTGEAVANGYCTIFCSWQLTREGEARVCLLALVRHCRLQH